MKRLCEFFPLRDWEQMSGFLREAYRPDLALRHRPIFEWQFMADRHGGNASMICAYEGDALIGIHGYLALPMFWGNVDQPIVGGWGINLYARPEFRSGLGWVLLKKLKEMHPVSIGVGASEQAERILVGKDADKIDRMVREAPERAYDVDFFQALAKEVGWKLGAN